MQGCSEKQISLTRALPAQPTALGKVCELSHTGAAEPTADHAARVGGIALRTEPTAYHTQCTAGLAAFMVHYHLKHHHLCLLHHHSRNPSTNPRFLHRGEPGCEHVCTRPVPLSIKPVALLRFPTLRNLSMLGMRAASTHQPAESWLWGLLYCVHTMEGHAHGLRRT